jgi:hypothetical protein
LAQSKKSSDVSGWVCNSIGVLAAILPKDESGGEGMETVSQERNTQLLSRDLGPDGLGHCQFFQESEEGKMQVSILLPQLLTFNSAYI